MRHETDALTFRYLSDLKPYTPEGFPESRPVKEEKLPD